MFMQASIHKHTVKSLRYTHNTHMSMYTHMQVTEEIYKIYQNRCGTSYGVNPVNSSCLGG